MAATRRRRPRHLNQEPAAVRYARQQSGLTQLQVAERCEVGFSLISEIELGTRNATHAMLNKLAEVLNCPRVVLEAKRTVEGSAATAARPPPEACTASQIP